MILQRFRERGANLLAFPREFFEAEDFRGGVLTIFVFPLVFEELAGDAAEAVPGCGTVCSDWVPAFRGESIACFGQFDGICEEFVVCEIEWERGVRVAFCYSWGTLEVGGYHFIPVVDYWKKCQR